MIDKEQRNNIKKDIERSIVHIARTHGVYNDEIRSILIDDYVEMKIYHLPKQCEYESYEEAIEAALKYCLENLI